MRRYLHCPQISKLLMTCADIYTVLISRLYSSMCRYLHCPDIQAVGDMCRYLPSSYISTVYRYIYCMVKYVDFKISTLSRYLHCLDMCTIYISTCALWPGGGWLWLVMTGARVKVQGPDSWHGRLRDRHRAILYGDNHYLHYFVSCILDNWHIDA